MQSRIIIFTPFSFKWEGQLLETLEDMISRIYDINLLERLCSMSIVTSHSCLLAFDLWRHNLKFTSTGQMQITPPKYMSQKSWNLPTTRFNFNLVLFVDPLEYSKKNCQNNSRRPQSLSYDLVV